MTDNPLASPPPLLEEQSELSAVLRHARAEYWSGNEAEAFARLERTRRRSKAVSRAAAAFAITGVLTAGQMLLKQRPASEPLIHSERVTLALAERSESRPSSEAIAPAPNLPTAPAPAITVTAAEKKATPAGRERKHSARRLSISNAAAPAPASAVATSAAPVADPAQCRRFAADHDIGNAVRCFRALAGGSDIDAEVASYEAARLSSEGGDPAFTLQLLDEHAARFGRGVMRAEAEWLRILTLQRAGSFTEALARSEALLMAPEGRPLASELHFLRGRIYEEAFADCGRAISDFVALVGETGTHGEEAEWRRARCLEKLGRGREAATAYERYIARRQAPPHHEEAVTRLKALRP